MSLKKQTLKFQILSKKGNRLLSMLEVKLLTGWSYILTLDTMVFLGFLLSCLCAFYFKRDSSIKIASSLYAASYGFSYFRSELAQSGTSFMALDAYYLNWVLYDAVTIFSIYIFHSILKVQHSKAVVLIFCLSFINMLSYLTMHYLAFVHRYESHWFYLVYSSMVNVTAFIMIFVFLFGFKYRWLSKCIPNYR